MEKIMVGSRAFFDGIEGFKSKDRDYLVLTDEPDGFNWRREYSMRNTCVFEYKKESARTMITKTIESGEALLMGKFLVPEVIEAIGATIADIRPLEALLTGLDDKHRYEACIFRAYIANNGFYLTDAQRNEAYAAYMEARCGIEEANEPEE